MKKKFLLMAAFLLTTGIAFGQNALTVENFTLPQNGGDIAVTLTLDEADKYTSYQFKIQTPEGVMYVVDAEDDVTCVLGTGHDATHGATAHWNSTSKILTVGVVSSGSKSFTGQTVKLEIPLAATTADIGTAFNFTVKEIAFIDKNGTKTYLDNVDFTATVGAPEVKRTLLDETSATAPEASDGAVNVRVKRTIKANEWSTICLPFAMDATQVKAAFGNDVQLADADSYETTEDGGDIVGINIKFNNATAIEANHPYIIKVSSAITSFVVDGVVVAPADKERNRRTSLGSGSYFVGNYVSQTAVPEFCLFLSGNKFWYSLGDTKIKAFRGYFDLKDVLTDVEDTYGSRIIMSFDEATGINTIDHSSFTIDRYYDLQGRSVENPGKGIYLKNGKKVVVK